MDPLPHSNRKNYLNEIATLEKPSYFAIELQDKKEGIVQPFTQSTPVYFEVSIEYYLSRERYEIKLLDVKARIKAP